MKRILVSLALMLTLVVMVAIPAAAADPVEDTRQASVTVNEIINFTVQDYGNPGINFGSASPGATNQPEAAQTASQGAVRLVVAAETNVAVNIYVKGSGDFTSGSSSLPLSSARYNAVNDPTGPGGANMSTNQQTPYSWAPDIASDWNLDIWHWISIPAGTSGGTYTTNFIYRAEKSVP